MVVRRGINESSVAADGRLGARGEASCSGSSSTWTSATRTAGASTRWCRPQELLEAIGGGLADRAGRSGATAARSPIAGATSTAAASSGSSRRSPSRSAATAPGPGSRPRASSTPACSPSTGTTLGPSCAPGVSDDGAGGVRRGDLDAARRSLLRAALRGDDRPAEDRDVRDGWLTAPLSTADPQRVDKSWMASTGPRASWWITALTAPRRRRATVVPARRGRQDRRTEIASRTIVPPPVASGASLPLRCGRLTTTAAGSCPAGRDRHPGVDTSVGPTKPARASAVCPDLGLRAGGPRV